MSIDTPIRDTTPVSSKSVDRRTLLKAGAWAAPVVLLTTAAPAMAASIEPVPTAQLTVTSGALTNATTPQALGPLTWAGGTIAWSRATPGQPTTASVSYTVAITGPGVSTTLVTSATNIANGGSFTVPGLTWGTAPLAAGTYTITLTAFGSDGSKSATSSVTLSSSITAVGSATYQGAGNSRQDRISALFTSNFTTAQTLTLASSSLPTGVTWQANPPASLSVTPGTSATAVDVGRTRGGSAGQTVSITYNVSGGGTVVVSVVLAA